MVNILKLPSTNYTFKIRNRTASFLEKFLDLQIVVGGATSHNSIFLKLTPFFLYQIVSLKISLDFLIFL